MQLVVGLQAQGLQRATLYFDAAQLVAVLRGRGVLEFLKWPAALLAKALGRLVLTLQVEARKGYMAHRGVTVDRSRC